MTGFEIFCAFVLAVLVVGYLAVTFLLLVFLAISVFLQPEAHPLAGGDGGLS
jgi:hypothetical protein